MNHDEQDEQNVINIPTIKRAKGLNYKDEMNLAIYLTEFNELTNEILNDPLTFGEAVNRIDKDLWLEAMHDEIRMLLKHETWTYVYPLKGANIIGTHFVYKIKRLANGGINKYKARLVVQGYAQKDGIDFYSDDLFAPVARLSTARLILSWAASNDFEIHQIDIKSAYLYGELKNDEIIYVRVPPGDLLPDVKLGQVLKLQKALYGLKQAGRRWYKTLTDILTKLGLTRSEYDNAVFLAKDKTRTVLILFIHVDDITLAGVNLSIIQSFKSSIKTYIEYTDGGDIHWLLGIEIKRN